MSSAAPARWLCNPSFASRGPKHCFLCFLFLGRINIFLMNFKVGNRRRCSAKGCHQLPWFPLVTVSSPWWVCHTGNLTVAHSCWLHVWLRCAVPYCPAVSPGPTRPSCLLCPLRSGAVFQTFLMFWDLDSLRTAGQGLCGPPFSWADSRGPGVLVLSSGDLLSA